MVDKFSMLKCLKANILWLVYYECTIAIKGAYCKDKEIILEWLTGLDDKLLIAFNNQNYFESSPCWLPAATLVMQKLATILQTKYYKTKAFHCTSHS